MNLYIDKKDCFGCGACAQICPLSCIEMTVDQEGFIYPSINSAKCTQCGACIKVCQIHFKAEQKSPLSIYALKNKATDVQKASSSGGFIFNLERFVLDDGGVVFKADLDPKSKKICHIKTRTLSLNKYRGSKYAQSEIGAIYQEIRHTLQTDNLVLFIGTPCQVVGLKKFLLKPYNNLITVDLICHGVGSPLVFTDFVTFLGKKHHSSVENINMRYKHDGWLNSRTIVKFCNGKEVCNTLETELFMRLYFTNNINRPSCHICRYTSYSRQGDITAGDYWGIQNVMPDFYDKNGCSLVMINTKQGESIFEQISSTYSYKSVTQHQCEQPQLSYPQESSNERNTFWIDYSQKGFSFVVKKYLNYTILSRIKRFIRNIINVILKKDED